VLGAVRGVAQIVSYEVILTLIVFLMLIMSGGLVDVSSVMKINEYFGLVFLIPFVYVLWIFCCVMESNRSPFDFSEGESELVSGFNTEYRAGGFALIFIAEYLRILFLRILGAILVRQRRRIVFFMILVVNRFVWIWLRGTFPRHRYDLVIYIT
jgi:NADH-ubiquinone oxidoreductase chain 1